MHFRTGASVVNCVPIRGVGGGWALSVPLAQKRNSYHSTMVKASHKLEGILQYAKGAALGLLMSACTLGAASLHPGNPTIDPLE